MKGINVYGFDSLVEIVEFLEDRRDYIPIYKKIKEKGELL